MKKILILLLLPLIGFSQQSRPVLINEINSKIYDNSTHKITGSILNGVLQDIVNSDLNKTTDPYLFSTGYGLKFSSGVVSLDSTSGSIGGSRPATEYYVGSHSSTPLTFNSPLSVTSNTVSISQSNGSVPGYLGVSDFNNFNGKFTLPSLTSGSILFSNGSTISQNNANLFWDNSTDFEGIGTNTPSDKLHIYTSTSDYRGVTIQGDLPLIQFKNLAGTADHQIGRIFNGSFYFQASGASGVDRWVYYSKTNNDEFFTIDAASNRADLIANTYATVGSQLQNSGSMRFRSGYWNGSQNMYNTPDEIKQVALTTSPTTRFDLGANIHSLSNGNVGIGIPAPTTELHVKGDLGFLWENAAANSGFLTTATNFNWFNNVGASFQADGAGHVWTDGTSFFEADASDNTWTDGTSLFEAATGGITYYDGNGGSFRAGSGNGTSWTGTENSFTTNTSLIGGNIVNGIIVVASGTLTLTMPTATDIQAASPSAIKAGTVLHFIVQNSASGGTCTLALNTGIVQDATSSINELTISNNANNGTSHFELVFISTTKAILKRLTYDNSPVSGTSNYKHTIFTPTTGGTVSLINNQYNIINPAGALLTLTVNLPSSPVNNDVVYIKFTQNVTTVTYGNGTVVDGITAPTAGGLTVLTYDSGTTSWY